MTDEKSESSDINFRLDNEQLDALRIETQSLPPKEQTQLDELITSSNNEFLQHFGRFISEGRILDSKEVARRFLVTDSQTHGLFVHEWMLPYAGQALTSYTKTEDAEIHAFPNIGNLLMGELSDAWELLSSENQWELIRKYGSRTKASDYVKQLYRKNIISHELAHLYEGSGMPLWFSEVGAYWYSEKLTNGKFEHKESQEKANFYQSLINIYGEPIHQIYFGGRRIQNNEREIINRSFTPVIQRRLFPGYKSSVIK